VKGYKDKTIAPEGAI